MTTVIRRPDTRVALMRVTLDELRLIALELKPGRVQELWDGDLLVVEQAEAMHAARAAAGLEP